MAELIPEIDPNNVTIDNIGSFEINTQNIINVIQDTDIPQFETKIEELEQFYTTKRKFFSKVPPPSKNGTIWFKLS